MERRTVLATVAGGVSLSGCLSRTVTGPSETTPSPTEEKEMGTPVRHTADGISATFQVVDVHEPVADTASATFDEDRVTVTGTMDPSGCDRPTLGAVRYNDGDGIIHLKISTESRFGPTATVECGNASFDYRSVLSADRGQPTAVEVVHDYQAKANQSFSLEGN